MQKFLVQTTRMKTWEHKKKEAVFLFFCQSFFLFLEEPHQDKSSWSRVTLSLTAPSNRIVELGQTPALHGHFKNSYRSFWRNVAHANSRDAVGDYFRRIGKRMRGKKTTNSSRERELTKQQKQRTGLFFPPSVSLVPAQFLFSISARRERESESFSSEIRDSSRRPSSWRYSIGSLRLFFLSLSCFIALHLIATTRRRRSKMIPKIEWNLSEWFCR